MGKGDKSARKGKIWRGSHGNARPKASNASSAPKTETATTTATAKS